MKLKERKEGRRKKNKEAQLMTKTKERQRKVTSQAKHKLHTENSKSSPKQMQAPLNMWMQTPKFQLTSSELSLSSPLLPLVDNV
jgi:hypothetical protein